MEIIAKTMLEVMGNPENEEVKTRARATVRELTAKHPLYPGLTVL